MSQPHAEPRQFNPVAGLLACAWPGAGHIYLGHPRRGLLIMFGVLFLFFGGLLVGGVDSVDRQRDHLWFLAQMLNGPVAFGADYVNQRFVKTRPEHVTLADGTTVVNANGPLATTSLGRVPTI